MRGSQTHDSYFRGILQRKGPRAIASGFVQEALNVTFIGGAPNSRPGLRPFHGVNFPAAIVGMGWHVYADGRRVLLVAAGSQLFRVIEGGDPVELTLAQLPVTENTRVLPERVYFLSLSGGTNTTFIYDGINQNLKYDDSEVLTRMGIDTPASPTVEGAHSAGLVPPGLHKYVNTFVSPHHESSPSETPLEVDTIGEGNRKFTIPSPVPDDPQVTLWRLYGTVAGGDKMLFVDEADIGVGIEVNVTDTTLAGRNAGRPVEFFVNDPPPAPAIAMAEHRGQLAAVFADDRGLIRFSNMDPDFMVPEGWPEDFVQPVAHADGDELTALASMHEWLFACKNNASFGIVGDTFAEYRVVPVLAAAGGKRIGIGAFCQGTVLQVENTLMFVSRDGIYKIDRFANAAGGIVADRLTGPVDDLFTAAKFSLGVGTFFDRVHRLFGFLGHG